MSRIDFDVVPLSKENFDGAWQAQIGLNIRLAAITVGKSKDELQKRFTADPEAMTAVAQSLSVWADKIVAYHDMITCAMARLLIVSSEGDGVPLEDEAGE